MKKAICVSVLIILISSLVVYANDIKPFSKMEVSNVGNDYYACMNMSMPPQNVLKKITCQVVHNPANNQYNREMRCFLTNYDSSREKFNKKHDIDDCNSNLYYTNNGRYLKNTIKLDTDTWKDMDKLIFDKYGKYSIWHNSPDSIVKDKDELIVARYSTQYGKKECLAKNGKYTYDVVTGHTTCTYKQDMTQGMTKQEKAEYNRAKEFEAEYENYLKYRDF